MTWWPPCGAASDVSLLLASVLGQNESGMGYCWIVISLYVVISVAKEWKNRSLMLCAGVWGFFNFDVDVEVLALLR